MIKNEFNIGLEFYTTTGKWLCTDLGSRVIVAIELNQDDEKNYKGPPYSVVECVFDENDFKGCALKASEFEENVKESIQSKTLDAIEVALMFVSSSGYGENTAIFDKKTEKVYYRSDMADIDEFEEFCESEYDENIHIEIPHKIDLDLGRDLVFEFIRRCSPEDETRVSQIFRRKRAYSNFKDFLDSKNILDKWYDFESSKEQEALESWCRENDIKIQ